MNRQKGLSASSLKTLAAICMFIDHLDYLVLRCFPQTSLLEYFCRGIGRISFPVFCFLLTEGFLHTSSRARYAARLCIFAILSELPYDMAFSETFSFLHSQNIFFTLLIGLLVLWGMEWFSENICFQAFVLLFGMGISILFDCDYGWQGILLIAILFFFRQDFFSMTAAGISVCLLWSWEAAFAFLPIRLYNKQRGWMKRSAAKYAFYLFYPLHLLLLVWMRKGLLS
ncbi:MAG: TraX family protein [Eubacteriales bacterium]|nr:TraX family protein [Eubacteriales bacterium]